MIKAAVVGGSGYVGQTLFRLLLSHRHAEVEIITSESLFGKKVKEEFPDVNSELRFTKMNIDDLNKMDIVFLSIPHGAAKNILAKLKTKVIDLTLDHRLTETYGLPELFKDEITQSRIIANPGCYATSCILASYPIKKLIKYVVFDCISGYSGGGKNSNYDFKENIIAYNLTNHNHINEMSHILPFKFSFTPHVVNCFKGIMCTAHISIKKNITTKTIKKLYEQYYLNSLTKIVDYIPASKEAVNSSYCIIGGFEIDKNNQLVIISVLDNLYKGAASQAIENMNLMFGFYYKEGLM